MEGGNGTWENECIGERIWVESGRKKDNRLRRGSVDGREKQVSKSRQRIEFNS